jgi:tetratricopeptide (TPR) repeat protein
MTARRTLSAHVTAGQPVVALHLLTEHLARAPGDGHAWQAAAEALAALGRPDEAVAAAQQAARVTPGPLTDAALALAFAHAGRNREALDAIERVLAEAPFPHACWERLARTFEALGEPEAGLVARREAVSLAPDDTELALRLADRLERADHRDEARALVARALAQVPNLVAERILVRIDHHDGRLDEAADGARRVIAALPDAPQSATWMELARIEARRGNVDAAWDAANRGNPVALRRWIADGGDVEAVPRALRALAALPVGPYPAPSPADGSAFVVGFPRSGTTLVQQLLEAHPAIRTLDELPLVDAAIQEVLPGAELATAVARSADPVVAAGLREAWWRRVESRVPPTDGIVLDKYPLNLMRVELLARAFPGSPVVVVLRDPRDAVLSAYLQDFELNPAMAQCADLERCAALYALLLSRWLQVRSALPGATELRYEDVVAAPEAALRPVIARLGLPWDPAVLDHTASARAQSIGTPSYRDVRQPVYGRSVGRWRAFAHHLAPVLPVLTPLARALGYED